jgi:hypothetical protein
MLPRDLLRKHARGNVLVDSNLLLLYLVGHCDLRIIPRNKKTARYTIPDFGLLTGLIETFKVVLTTPNIITEVSNLATSLSENERPSFFDVMRQRVTALEERYCPSIEAFTDPQYRRLGITDAVLLKLCPRVLVLTDDFPLYAVISKRGHDVINFTQIREAAGNFE